MKVAILSHLAVGVECPRGQGLAEFDPCVMIVYDRNSFVWAQQNISMFGGWVGFIQSPNL
jgi:hypothetical protein